MCKTSNFCHCMTLKAGTFVALIISMFYGFFYLLFALYKVHDGTKEGDYWKIARGLALVWLIVVFGIGVISLTFSLMTSKSGLSIFWLAVAMLFIVLSIFDTLFLVREVSYKELRLENAVDFIEVVLVVLFDAFMIYLWIVVLNYYRDLRDKERERKEKESGKA